MKKSLLLVAALAAGMTMNAQESAYFETVIGLSSDLTSVTGGTEIGSTSLVTAYIGADDSYKATSINGPKDSQDASFRTVTFNGDLSMSETDVTDAGYDAGGIQGNSNPKDIDGSNSSSSFSKPVSGAYFEFVASGNGYLYYVGKMSSNKAYTVFEEGSCLAYEFAMGVADGEALTYDLYDYGDEYGYLTLSGDLASGISNPETINSSTSASSTSGVGYIGFPIYSGCTYQLNANGSKASGLGFVTSTEEITSIVLTSDNSSITLKGDSSTGITSVKTSTTESDEDAPIYNLAGQRVTKDYKGVLIQNGKKFMNK